MTGRIRKRTLGTTIRRAKGYKINRHRMMGKTVYILWRRIPSGPNKGWTMAGGPSESYDNWSFKRKWKKFTGKELR